ncbi:MAG: 30S ribosome-binding factor RbfA [Clostridia bacterium]|nr:30S ribosome-binding factor RbfA [Clostridia bacterium]
MASHRMNRISEDISRELTAILRTVKDPRVTGLVSIVRVDVTNDLSYATVYISSMDGIEAAKQAVVGLRSAAGYMRSSLGRSLKQLRHVPELRFVADDSIAYSVDIAKTLMDLEKERLSRTPQESEMEETDE